MIQAADKMVRDTRSDFIAASKQLFARRGFYGVSIAAIAEELGLTKQALLHHFGSKEKLYGEVLHRISRNLETLLEKENPETFKATMKRLQDGFLREPHSAAIIMRELLDNEPRAAGSRVWYLKPLLDRLCDLAENDPDFAGLSRMEVFARVYAMAGAANYLAVSKSTLDGMYGEGFHETLVAAGHRDP